MTYARVSRWEGADPAGIERFAEMVESADGPPEGVPSTGIMVLTDPDNGRWMIIGLFDTEEDLRVGDAALRAMDRPPGATGDITAIECYQVAVDRRTASA